MKTLLLWNYGLSYIVQPGQDYRFFAGYHDVTAELIAKSLDDNYETIIIDDEKQFNELYNS